MNSGKSVLFGVVLALLSLGAQAQRLNDPALDGMKVLPRVEGCDAPGGLFPITSSDGPNDAPFWCGAPPYCLTKPVGNVERCHIIPGVRQGGLRGVRNPTDLLCDVTNINPTGPTHALPGRCPVPPTLGATINNVQVATVSQGANVTLRVNTANATPLSAPTALTMACSGTNAVISPFNQTNLNAYAGRNYSFPAVAASNAGATSCTITATNAAGSVAYQVSFNATPTVSTPAPTVSATFNPTSPTAGGSVQLVTRTTNATALRWSCTGRWTNSNTSRGVGTVTTNHTASGSAGAATCTFTATGPGGTASTTARWTSVSSGGGGGGIVVGKDCAGGSISWRDSWRVTPGGTCRVSVPTTQLGDTVRLYSNRSSINPSAPSVGALGYNAYGTATCNNGVWNVRAYCHYRFDSESNN